MHCKPTSLNLYSGGLTTTRARGIMKVASMHPIRAVVAEADRREMAKLENDESDEEEDDDTLTEDQLEERNEMKKRFVSTKFCLA